MTTTGERLVTLSGLPTGTAMDHFLAITTGGGVAPGDIVNSWVLAVPDGAADQAAYGIAHDPIRDTVWMTPFRDATGAASYATIGIYDRVTGDLVNSFVPPWVAEYGSLFYWNWSVAWHPTRQTMWIMWLWFEADWSAWYNICSEIDPVTHLPTGEWFEARPYPNWGAPSEWAVPRAFTYDQRRGCWWFGAWDSWTVPEDPPNSWIARVTDSGELIEVFTGDDGYDIRLVSGLAYNPVTDTLWCGNLESSGNPNYPIGEYDPDGMTKLQDIEQPWEITTSQLTYGLALTCDAHLLIINFDQEDPKVTTIYEIATGDNCGCIQPVAGPPTIIDAYLAELEGDVSVLLADEELLVTVDEDFDGEASETNYDAEISGDADVDLECQ